MKLKQFIFILFWLLINAMTNLISAQEVGNTALNSVNHILANESSLTNINFNHSADISTILPNALNNSFNLNSTIHSILAGEINHFDNLTISLASHSTQINSNTYLTPAESLLVKEVLSHSNDLLVLNNNGQAIGGDFNLNLIQNFNNGLVIPHNVTAYDTSNNLNIAGNLVNYGNLIIDNTNNTSINTTNFINQFNANVFGISHFGSSQTITINSTHDFINAGNINLIANLNIQAQNDIANLGLILANNIDVTSEIGYIANNNLVEASGDLFLNTNNSPNLEIQASQGTFTSEKSIFINSATNFSGNTVLYVNGGNFELKDEFNNNAINFIANQGNLHIDIANTVGQVNLQGHNLSLEVASSNLKLNDFKITGDPLIINTSGDITLPAGGITTGGYDLVVLASRSIFSNATNPGVLDTSLTGYGIHTGSQTNVITNSGQVFNAYNGGAGNITLVAGASITNNGSTVTLNGSSNTGGNIILTGLTALNTYGNGVNNTSAPPPGSTYFIPNLNAGNVVIAAYGSAGSSTGQIILSNSTNIVTGGTSNGDIFTIPNYTASSGLNGNVLVLSGAQIYTYSTPTITLGSIITTPYNNQGNSSIGGSVYLYTQTPLVNTNNNIFTNSATNANLINNPNNLTLFTNSLVNPAHNNLSGTGEIKINGTINATSAGVIVSVTGDFSLNGNISTTGTNTGVTIYSGANINLLNNLNTAPVVLVNSSNSQGLINLEAYGLNYANNGNIIINSNIQSNIINLVSNGNISGLGILNANYFFALNINNPSAAIGIYSSPLLVSSPNIALNTSNAAYIIDSAPNTVNLLSANARYLSILLNHEYTSLFITQPVNLNIQSSNQVTLQTNNGNLINQVQSQFFTINTTTLNLALGTGSILNSPLLIDSFVITTTSLGSINIIDYSSIIRLQNLVTNVFMLTSTENLANLTIDNNNVNTLLINSLNSGSIVLNGNLSGLSGNANSIALNVNGSGSITTTLTTGAIQIATNILAMQSSDTSIGTLYSSNVPIQTNASNLFVHTSKNANIIDYNFSTINIGQSDFTNISLYCFGNLQFTGNVTGNQSVLITNVSGVNVENNVNLSAPIVKLDLIGSASIINNGEIITGNQTNSIFEATIVSNGNLAFSGNGSYIAPSQFIVTVNGNLNLGNLLSTSDPVTTHSLNLETVGNIPLVINTNNISVIPDVYGNGGKIQISAYSIQDNSNLTFLANALGNGGGGQINLSFAANIPLIIGSGIGQIQASAQGGSSGSNSGSGGLINISNTGSLTVNPIYLKNNPIGLNGNGGDYNLYVTSGMSNVNNNLDITGTINANGVGNGSGGFINLTNSNLSTPFVIGSNSSGNGINGTLLVNPGANSSQYGTITLESFGSIQINNSLDFYALSIYFNSAGNLILNNNFSGNPNQITIYGNAPSNDKNNLVFLNGIVLSANKISINDLNNVNQIWSNNLIVNTPNLILNNNNAVSNVLDVNTGFVNLNYVSYDGILNFTSEGNVILQNINLPGSISITANGNIYSIFSPYLPAVLGADYYSLNSRSGSINIANLGGYSNNGLAPEISLVLSSYGSINISNISSNTLNLQSVTAGGAINITSQGNLVAQSSITTGVGSRSGGNIDLTTYGSNLSLIGTANLTANNGSVIINDQNTTNGSVNINPNITIRGTSSTPGIGTVQVIIGQKQSLNTNNPNPNYIGVHTAYGANVYFGKNGIEATSNNNVLFANGRDITFNTGNLPANSITLGGNVKITADPPISAYVANSINLRNNDRIFSSVFTQPPMTNLNINNFSTQLNSNINLNKIYDEDLPFYNRNDNLEEQSSISKTTSKISYRNLQENSYFNNRNLKFNNNCQLTNGLNLILVKKNMVLNLNSSIQISFKQGTIVLIALANYQDNACISVYNLDDQSSKSIEAVIDGKQYFLNTGQQFFISREIKQFKNLMNSNIFKLVGYKNMISHTNQNWVLYKSDYSIISLLQSLKINNIDLYMTLKPKQLNKIIKTAGVINLTNFGAYKQFANYSQAL